MMANRSRTSCNGFPVNQRRLERYNFRIKVGKLKKYESAIEVKIVE
jgi:hypothetical protein